MPPPWVTVKYTYNPDENGEYPEYTTADFKCYPGYEIFGYVQQWCRGGEWLYEFPKCIGLAKQDLHLNFKFFSHSFFFRDFFT